MKQNNKKIKDKNRTYFQSLVATRASLEKVKSYFAGAFFGIVFLATYWFAGSHNDWAIPFDPYSLVMTGCILFMTVFSLIGFLPSTRRKLYLHQDVASIYQLIFVILLVVEFILGCLFLATIRDGSYEFYTLSTGYLLLLFCLVYLISLVYNLFWLKKQLQVGFSSERTAKNFLAAPAVQGLGSLGMIFSGNLIGRFMTKGQANVFGIVLGIFLMIVFSRLTVEYAYVSRLKRINQTYWEEYKPEDGLAPNKTFYWRIFTFIEVVVFVIISYLGNSFDQMETWKVRVLGSVMMLILLDWLIRLVRRCIKKKDRDTTNE